ncbi:MULTISPECIES: glycerol kinase GlpK [unclassified Parafrankia]|uniref:glycerol kinase GlpK n=1 Tax=unclassified Parafrankia TaxID=2994368 RepID=UPI000DA501B4|nr:MULTISPECIES: glycerol kinase GlpK [unclassified Parafrankia]TCJ37667.1 glycerol kinase [Parafrankia sp. BMG5.11]CAI7979336.1 Glycerol kinase [Frankia sp. Hr75.2]SQD97683.1 Glycerol kinase [Parafrankia sp. Ea1.12]
MLVAAVDQGTTGTTVCLLDEEAAVVGRGYRAVGTSFPRPGWVEQDPAELLRGVVDTVAAALADAGRAPSDLAAVGITNQRETTVLWERRTGRPLHPAVVWQDRRTADVCERLAAAGHGPRVQERTGLVLDPYFSGTKAAWVLDHVDGARRAAAAGEVAFGTVDSWLVWGLTGGRAHITDVTNASRTMLFDLADGAWSAEMCDLLDVPAELLAEVVPSSRVYAETDPEVFLGVRVPIAAVVGDQQAALFAQACFEPGQAKNTYGTGSFVLVNTGATLPAPQSSLLRTVAFGLDGESLTYALEGAILSTGSAVQWLRDGLGVISDAEQTAALAASLDGNDGVYFVPALAGLGAPHWDPRARGTLVGLTRATGRAHLARAVLEGIAYQTRDVVEEMAAGAGVTVTQLRADGGAARNPWLMQFQADILGVEVDVPENIETTALGSGYLAGLATGVYAGRDELDARRRTAARYQPAMGEDQRAELYGQWLRAVERSRDWDRG